MHEETFLTTLCQRFCLHSTKKMCNIVLQMFSSYKSGWWIVRFIFSRKYADYSIKKCCICVRANVRSVDVRVLFVKKIAQFIDTTARNSTGNLLQNKISYPNKARFPIWLTSCLFEILLKVLLCIRMVTITALILWPYFLACSII